MLLRYLSVAASAEPFPTRGPAFALVRTVAFGVRVLSMSDVFGRSSASEKAAADLVLASVRWFAGHEPAATLDTALGTALARAQLDPESLARSARHHRVQAIVLAALRHAGADPGLAPGLEEDVDQQLVNELRTCWDLQWLAARLVEVTDQWAVLKGPALAEVAYEDTSYRHYRDLDVLVSPRDARAVIEHLDAAGAPAVDRNWTVLIEEGRGQVHVELPQGSLLDLHWHLVNRRVVRDTFRIHTSELLGRARQATLLGSTARVLEPIDMLLHVTVHAALSGGQRLQWLLDIDQASRDIAIDPAVLRDRAVSARCLSMTVAMLEEASEVLGTPLHGAMSRSVFDPRMTLLRTARRARPVQYEQDAFSPPAILTAALRDGLPWLTLPPRVSRWASAAALRRRLRWHLVRSADGARSGYGGPEARERFLAAISESESESSRGLRE